MPGFTGIENLAGGAGQDVFTVTAMGASLTGGITAGGEDDQITIGGANNAVSGVVNAGAGNDTVTLDDGADLTGGGVGGGAVDTAGNDRIEINGTVTGDLTDLTGDNTFVLGTGAILNGVITGSAAGVDVIEGGATASVYRIDNVNTGLIDGRVDRFTDIDGLTGGDGVPDTFRFEGMGSLTGAIVGGTGPDTIEGLDGVADSVTLTGTDAALAGDASFAGGGFSDIENLDLRDGADSVTLTAGSNLTGTLDGGAGIDSLTGPDTATTFNVDGPAAGQGNVTGGATVNEFQSIENLTGGDQSDTFNVNADLAGDVNGGLGDDTLNLAVDTTIGGDVNDVENVNLVVDGTNAADTIEIEVVGGILQAVINGSVSQFFTPTGTTSVSLTVNGLDGVDTLILDYASGPLPDEITFADAADGDTERVRIEGTVATVAQEVSLSDTLDINGRRVVTLVSGGVSQTVAVERTRSAAYLIRYSPGWAPPSSVVMLSRL